MSQELEHKILNDILEVVQKYDFKESAPSVVTALSKLIGATIGHITGNAAWPDETVCKKACHLVHLDTEKVALRAHNHTVKRHKESVAH